MAAPFAALRVTSGEDNGFEQTQDSPAGPFHNTYIHLLQLGEWPKEGSWDMQFLGKLFIQAWERG